MTRIGRMFRVTDRWRRIGVARASPLAALVALVGCGDALGPPQPIPFAAVDAGGAHTCAIAESGEAYCWGRGEEGQLGNEEGTGSMVPVRSSGDARYTAISTGRDHTCAVADPGTAYCWGGNADGQLGIGGTAAARSPGRVVGDLRFADVAAGGYHTCGLTDGSAVYCWGSNVDGQLGYDSTAEMSTGPVRVAGSHEFTRLTAGESHTCALTDGGDAYCWGANRFGQLGDGTADDARSPSRVRGGHHFVAIAAGETHTCALTGADVAYCWGSNSDGEVGNHTFLPEGAPGFRRPDSVHTWRRFDSIVAGRKHTCALDGDEPHCWGSGLYGQLGDALLEASLPRRVFTIDRTRFSTLTTGRTHTCALTRSGVVYCWGTGEQGQLGHPSITFSPSPLRVDVRGRG